MKNIFFTLKPPQGSYGGGAFFVKNFSRFLTQRGFNVVYDLKPGIDLIIIIDPRVDSYNRYGIRDIKRYKRDNPLVKIIHRVNECDIKRPVSIDIEKLIIETMHIADVVVFVSSWLRNYYLTRYRLNNINSMSILNGVDKAIFKPSDKKELSLPLKIVTHHWSSNYYKGFHIYNKLDKYVADRDDLEFVYIGNYNSKYTPRNTQLHPPTTGLELATLLKGCHVYLTATRNEPGAMHYLEGMACGLPVLYQRGGGGTSEICHGIEFNDFDHMLECLRDIKENYNTYTSGIPYDKLGSERCSWDYYKVVKTLI